ncbi:Aldo/keto reductase [Cenococcum geophilum 1.58]|uniref:Aldo/keto reductase n=1 Tax=Cenococcum geophilum 1.58 TaxID=794803 RepID=UPI00358F92AE|nr:Aldo/keto reductase [Cenococcum geophilum 1.58]
MSNSRSPFGDIPTPRSLLDFHRILSPTAGVRVSPLCLGAMNFGDAWKDMMGECNKQTTFEILDYFFENGGNFIDTANSYQAEESETWIGEWMAERGVRDQMVVATKFTTCFPAHSRQPSLKVNYAGNSSKSLHISLEASLKKLQTSYIDLLYVHWWDWSTSIPELMQSLNDMVAAGKVLYLGVSDTPAWIVSKANEYARNHGLRQFTVYQGHWSAASRDFERDILPMAQAEGMALAPWGALGRGNFKSDAERARNEGRKSLGTSETDIRVSKKLEEIATVKGTLITSVALAYVMHKAPYVFPIVGGRKVEHLKGNIEALGLELTEQEIDEIDAASAFDIGFPMSMLFEFISGKKYNTRMTTADVGPLKFAGNIDAVANPAPIKPHKKL